MPLRFKIDVISALKEKGYTTYRIRGEKLLSESTLQKLRTGAGISWESIETICRLLDRQPGDIIEYVRETDASASFHWHGHRSAQDPGQ